METTEPKKQRKKLNLGIQILIGAAVGLIIGFVSPTLAEALSPLGDIFLRLLKMLIVPLVFFSITSGITKMGSVKQLFSVGGRFVLYIVITSGLCSVIGIIMGLVSNVGTGTTDFLADAGEVEVAEYSMIDTIVGWVPDNIVSAMVNADLLQIIIFCAFLGSAILVLGDKVKTVRKLIDQGSDIMLKITDFVMAYSPIGIGSLIATLVTSISGSTVKDVLLFIGMDYAGGLIALVIMYPIIIKFFAKLPVFKFFKAISQPMLVAVTTTSSAATLPVSLRTAREKLGISEDIYGFTLPLGNTAGMNGFAVYIGLFCVFCCHLYGVQVTFENLLLYVFLGIVLSIGAAGVKGAGIVMSGVILETIGMPLTIMPIIAAMWSVVDPIHTLLNNTSDHIGTAVIARKLGRMDMDVFEGRKVVTAEGEIDAAQDED